MTEDKDNEPSPQEMRVRLGRNVCEARTKLGWTQEQLGAPEFSSSYISALERGKITISLKALSIIARRLNVPQERLLEDSPEEGGGG